MEPHRSVRIHCESRVNGETPGRRTAARHQFGCYRRHSGRGRELIGRVDLTVFDPEQISNVQCGRLVGCRMAGVRADLSLPIGSPMVLDWQELNAIRSARTARVHRTDRRRDSVATCGARACLVPPSTQVFLSFPSISLWFLLGAIAGWVSCTIIGGMVRPSAAAALTLLGRRLKVGHRAHRVDFLPVIGGVLIGRKLSMPLLFVCAAIPGARFHQINRRRGRRAARGARAAAHVQACSPRLHLGGANNSEHPVRGKF